MNSQDEKKLKKNKDLKEFESIWILDFGVNMDQAMVYQCISCDMDSWNNLSN